MGQAEGVGVSLVTVTEEMQNIGGIAANEVCFRLFMAKWNTSDAEQIACFAYRAMHAAAPVPMAIPLDRLDEFNWASDFESDGILARRCLTNVRDHYTERELTDIGIRARYWVVKAIREWSAHLTAAAAPVPLVSEAEDRIAALEAELQTERAWITRLGIDHGSLTQENILLRAENTRLHDALKVRTDEKAAMQTELADAMERVAFVGQILTETLAERHALRAELQAAHDLLAQRPAPVLDTPKPAHDPFREHATDRRRMGL